MFWNQYWQVIEFSPIFVMEIVFVEGSDKFFEPLFGSLNIIVISILVVVRIEIIRKENGNIIETFHFSLVLKIIQIGGEQRDAQQKQSKIFKICKDFTRSVTNNAVFVAAVNIWRANYYVYCLKSLKSIL